jgi:hypothetical protein
MKKQSKERATCQNHIRWIYNELEEKETRSKEEKSQGNYKERGLNFER